MKRIGFIGMVCALLLTGCVSHLDPYAGTEGLRVNVNGQKCVMELVYVSSSHSSPSYTYTDNVDGKVEFSFRSNLVHKRQEMSGLQVKHDNYRFSLSLETAGPLVLDRAYDVTAGIGPEDLGDDNLTPLHGTITFLSLSPAIQARFEMASAGNAYVLRHGFLRFNKKQ